LLNNPLHQRTRRNIAVKIVLALVAFAIAGCDAFVSPPRTPTRPDGAGDSNNGGGQVGGAGPLTDAAECVELGPPSDIQHRDMFELVSNYRVRNGLNALTYSQSLQRAADAYAMRLYREDFFDHVAPDGSRPGDRAVAAGYCDTFVGENLAYGLNQLSQADDAMQGFIDSPGHNENMLRPDWDYVGVGYLKISGPQGDEYWWVQMFGRE
jgi:hypothetical protein